eukprot:CAMPEP_0170197540 /NCGR_PEP_ID=MMETSP0040_2-20121228/66624_1 /TAXON_ID=641309 /ORGANISM="Lotharella oceanica, Strain CCMP622" /LENGTH=517 /DNA_ID=CAMNT_0010447233 /DNA_START=66 /DNA_END=1618 /DNA_ORIENTATION=-
MTKRFPGFLKPTSAQEHQFSFSDPNTSTSRFSKDAAEEQKIWDDSTDSEAPWHRDFSSSSSIPSTSSSRVPCQSSASSWEEVQTRMPAVPSKATGKGNTGSCRLRDDWAIPSLLVALASFSRARNPSASQITSMSTSQLKGILKSAGKSAIGIVDRTELVSRVIAVSNPGFLWSVGAAALDIVWGVTSTLCACLSAIGGGVIPAFLRGVWYCLAGIGTLLSYACAGMYGLLCYLASQGTVLSHACAGIYGLLYRVVYTPLVWLAHLLTTLAKLAYASATWILQAAWTVRLLPWLSYIGIEIKLHPRLQFLESVFFALGVIWLSRSATRSWLRRLVAAPGSTGIGELNSEWSTAGEDVGNECVRRELEHSHTSTRESMEYNIAYAQFKKRMPSREPSRICRYDSKPVAEVFASKRAAMKRAGKSVEERWVFHGTDLGNVSSIMRGGFKIGGRDDVKVANGSSYGTGVYSSHTPTAPLKYGKGKCVILAKALIGRNDSRNWGGSVDVDKYDSWSPVHDW